MDIKVKSLVSAVPDFRNEFKLKLEKIRENFTEYYKHQLNSLFI